MAVLAVLGAVVFGLVFGIGKLSDHRALRWSPGWWSSSSAPCRSSC